MNKLHTRRSDTEKHQAGGLHDGIKRYYDHNLEHTVVKLMTGDCYFTGDRSEMLVTILGSCVSVCVRDPVAKCGGMNHILLPDAGEATINRNSIKDPGFELRFGAYSMEQLLNGLYKLGAQKHRLEVKVFGGANVVNFNTMIGTKNSTFVLDFLKNEGIAVASRDIGGSHPRRLHYFPDTGKVMMRRLRRADDMRVVEEEKSFQKTAREHPEEITHTTGDIELFV